MVTTFISIFIKLYPTTRKIAKNMCDFARVLLYVTKSDEITKNNIYAKRNSQDAKDYGL